MNAPPQMVLEVLCEDVRWESMDLRSLTAATAEMTLAQVGLQGSPVELSVLACDDERIATLNTDFRGKAGATNVLSWPADDLAAAHDGGQPEPPQPGPDGVIALGDVAISYDTCLREAVDMAKPMAEHSTHLIVHGILHLLGYDHIRDRDALLMQDMERKILGKMGLNDPYTE
ncbi:MAG: rRNA maturation RNase YbeY [Roseobacter sp.]|jgi:probable rRNA maturation factor|nr:rRNA maturation RNase YbeY [Roseobacter sp.]